MDRMLKPIQLCFFLVILVLLPACASLPNKRDAAIGKERFVYALQGTGEPVVIFEAGLGSGMDTWAPVYTQVAAFTTAFAYDRRGYGESGKPVGTPKVSSIGEIGKSAVEIVLDTVVPGASTAVSMGTIATRSADKGFQRTGAVVVTELHDLLRNADVRPPYVLGNYKNCSLQPFEF